MRAQLATLKRLCVQDHDESLPASMQRFLHFWEESVDADMGKGGRSAVKMFTSNVHPHVANLDQNANGNWCGCKWNDLVCTLMDMCKGKNL